MSKSNRILLVEDDKNLGQTLKDYLESLGHECILANTANEARKSFKILSPEILLMDIGLPDGDGLSLAKEFRTYDKTSLLFFLSAQNDPETRVEGLEIGADDYITKPFALKELVLRLNRAMQLRSRLDTSVDKNKFGKLEIRFKSFELVDADGNIHMMGQKECGILKLLLDKKNQVVDRNEIIDQIWGKDSFPSNRTVDNYIVKLRKWSDSDPSSGLQIQSIRGVGYKLAILE